jgi:dTDP-4-dehydrorhamnose reductase
MKVLITGANGMVARAAIRHCHSIGDEVVGLTRSDLDISDADAVAEIFDKQRPDVVLNCAAYTDVDGAQSNREASHLANTDGVGNLAAASHKYGSRFVTISTDYVFDGENTGFYTQRDTPNPHSVYAVTKYAGERLATEKNAASIVVRSGWIYGEGGTNFLSVMHRLLAEGRSIKAIRDSYGTPTYAGDLARRLRELADLNMPCIFHVTNSGPGTSYLGFAEVVCRIGGFDPKMVEPVSKDSLSRPAPRPASSKLACLFSDRFGLDPLPDWEQSLSRFLKIEEA